MANAPGIEEEREKIQGILDSADAIAGYNNSGFDDVFLMAEGFKLPSVNFDAMRAFAPLYGEWSEWLGGYKSQRLEVAADHYGYVWEGGAHSALEDAKAALFVAKKIIGDYNERGNGDAE